METVKAVLDKFKGAMRSDLIQNIIRDIKSTRSLWCWVYLALYVWIAAWALMNRPQAARTVVSVTGGLAGSIFTGYVFSKSFEKRHRIGAYAPPAGAPEPGRGETPPLPAARAASPS